MAYQSKYRRANNSGNLDDSNLTYTLDPLGIYSCHFKSIRFLNVLNEYSIKYDGVASQARPMLCETRMKLHFKKTMIFYVA